MIRRYPVITYYLLALAISGACLYVGYVPLHGAMWLIWMGAFAPAAASMILTGLLDGKAGLEALLARLFCWRAPAWVYLAVFVLPFAWMAVTYALYPLLGDTSRDAPLVSFGGWLADIPGRLPLLLGLAPLFMVILAGEEIGWRGFAQPRLEQCWGPLKASLMVGFMWGLWHIPAAIDPNNVLRRASLWYSIPLFTLSTMVCAIIYTWLMHHSDGSLLIASLFHGWFDLFNGYASVLFPFFINQYWIYNLVVTLTAGVLIICAYPFRQRTGNLRPRQVNAPL